MMRPLACLLALTVTAGVGVAGDGPLRTAPVKRGTLPVVVQAPGQLQPEEVVEVSTLLTGTIQKFGADPNNPNRPVDYNSVVKAGTVMAQIDPRPFEVEVARAKVDLQRAEAGVLLARAKHNQAKLELERAKKRVAAKVADAAEVELAQAGVDVAEANSLVELATLKQQQVALERTELQLLLTAVRSPVDGVVIERRVNAGQAVGPGTNSSTLFVLAADLKKLQLWAQVREADLRAAGGGKTVTFTAESFGEQRIFKGRVAPNQPRLNPTRNQDKGELLFTVVIEVDNADEELKPYVSAQVRFQGEVKKALLVPSAALRWYPEPKQVVEKYRGSVPFLLQPNRPVLWVVDKSGLVRPVLVRTGLSDGTMTEIVSGELTEGTPVVVGAGPELKGKK